ncbi:MAG: aminoacyl-histidine dipeptidase [Alysiella sp.]|uniref:aminoacyl-histidine dipeptidase n=1 Tax=Alysiella sp. TaxID=1872483 RepID=UPI0026DCEC05|nr:aminoacyl-histidine dipeptidase [Alysiella sp.]MDO4433255.1 aminoacyl-histidine dipeptidase [Alysiella sp.]
MPLSQLYPQTVWHYFSQLCRIPRPSHHETAVQQFVLDEAQRLGLHAERDAVGNVLVRKPATRGKEHLPCVILQSHLDMVAQKNHDSTHDFLRDPIQPYVQDGWVYARGTTLGADNGIGAAATLAVLAANNIEHGEIEALFTATEETGMDGAKGLQGGWLKGSILLNLDTEDLGEICIGCAGGIDGTFSLPINSTQIISGSPYRLTIRGLKGGHSGIDIVKQRGNAIKIMVQILRTLHKSHAIQIADLQGGTLRNAIPREAEAVFTSTSDFSVLENQINELTLKIRATLNKEDQNMIVALESSKLPEQVWTHDCQQTILQTLSVAPNGVDSMNPEIAGLVETSGNLAKAQCVSGSLNVHYLLRSQNDFARDDLASRLKDLFELAGGTGELSGTYTGWQPIAGSPITRLLIQEGEKLLGKTPEIKVIHAGLECGILATHYPHWQMASFGPTIEMPHSPDERVNIESVELFWQWLVNVLANLANTTE